jgi:hypothetical protein
MGERMRGIHYSTARLCGGINVSRTRQMRVVFNWNSVGNATNTSEFRV